MLDALQHAVIATDTLGRITDWSASAEALYGWKREDVIGRNILEVTPSSLSRAEAAAIMETLRAGDVWSCDFRVKRRGGEEFAASVTDVPMLDDSQLLTGIVGLSAPAGSRTPLSVIMRRFGEACDRLWPGAVSVELHLPDDAMLAVTDPHLIQLMALLMIRQAPALDGGSHVQIVVRTANAADFGEFVEIPWKHAVHIRFAWSDHEMLDSLSTASSVLRGAERQHRRHDRGDRVFQRVEATTSFSSRRLGGRSRCSRRRPVRRSRTSSRSSR